MTATSAVEYLLGLLIAASAIAVLVKGIPYTVALVGAAERPAAATEDVGPNCVRPGLNKVQPIVRRNAVRP